MPGKRLFIVYMRCENCLRLHKHHLRVPMVEDAPSDLDELADSSALQTIPFKCEYCDSTIAKVVALKQPSGDAADAA